MSYFIVKPYAQFNTYSVDYKVYETVTNMKLKLFCIIIFSISILIAPFSIYAQNDDFKNKSIEELAKELANPNTPLTSLKFKNQFRTYKGDLAGASDQSSYVMLFQSTLPFPLENGKTLWIRPSVPILTGIPYYNNGSFDSKSGLGDIVFDFQYGDTKDNGFLWSIGATATIPTATSNELGGNWAIGPGFQLGKISKKYIGGFFLNYQYGNSPTNDKNCSLTTLQVFNVFLPSGGWSIASGPILTYNHSNGQWEIPINFAVGKTVKSNKRAWKFAIELNYYVSQYDALGPQWMIGFNIAPVVKNVIYDWIN